MTSEEIYEKYYKRLFYDCLSYVKYNDKDAEDLAHDTFYRFFKKHPDGFTELNDGHLIAYLRKTLKYIAISRNRLSASELIKQSVSINTKANSSRDETIEDVLAGSYSADDFINTEFSDEMQKAVDSLTKRQREIFFRIFLDDEDQNEVLSSLGLKSIKATISRAREQIRRSLESSGVKELSGSEVYRHAPNNKQDLSNTRCGKVVILGWSGVKDYWIAKCDCGRYIKRRGNRWRKHLRDNTPDSGCPSCRRKPNS